MVIVVMKGKCKDESFNIVAVFNLEAPSRSNTPLDWTLQQY